MTQTPDTAMGSQGGVPGSAIPPLIGPLAAWFLLKLEYSPGRHYPREMRATLIRHTGRDE
jgi:hypothetical protein